MRTFSARRGAGAAIGALLAMTTTGIAEPSVPVRSPGTSFTIVGDDVHIHGIVTVKLADLRGAIDSVHEAGRAGGRAAALRRRLELPEDVRTAFDWEMTQGYESRDAAGEETPPEEDVDKAAAQDPEPPAQVEDPPKTVDSATSANYTTPAPVCTWYNATDRRQMNSPIFRLTVYKFNIDVTWRGCDNGTNLSSEPFLVWYSEVDIMYNCHNDQLTYTSGPLRAPWIKHFARGKCEYGAEVNSRRFYIGHNAPFINNTYDYIGKRTTREGSAR